MLCWLRFSGANKVTLDLAVHLQVVPGLPHSWSAEALDRSSQSQGLDAHGNVKCGQYFCLEITALDAFNNRYDSRQSSVSRTLISDNSLL